MTFVASMKPPVATGGHRVGAETGRHASRSLRSSMHGIRLGRHARGPVASAPGFPEAMLNITAVACVLLSSTARADAPIGIEVYPLQIRLDSARERQRVLVQAMFADGRTEHVATAALKPSDPKLFAVEGAVLRPLADGQGKLLVCALIAAQASCIADGTGRQPALLIDDISSELDRYSCKAALSLLLSGNGQAFVTTIEAAPLLQSLPTPHQAWFHVERGQVVPA